MIKVKYLGIVEGFFSGPLQTWSWKERSDLLIYINKYAKNINSYFYCPKDDPYVTSKWNKLYPGDKLKKLSKFIAKCNNQQIKFIYGFNPQIDPNTKWIEPTILKINQLLNIGCKNICLLFDDIPLSYEVLENDINTSFKYRVFVNAINKIYYTLNKTLKEFWLCSPDYFFTKETPLTRVLKRLDQNIGLIWSGPQIFVKNIYSKDFMKVKKVLGEKRKIILWFNYPVNDCEQNIGMFNLGGIPKISSTIANQLKGFYVNPMREAYANLPALATFSEYIKNPLLYSRQKSMDKIVIKLIASNTSFTKLLTNISQRNPVDSKPRIIFMPFNLDSIKLKNYWGRKFMKAINSLICQYKLLGSIKYKIVNNEVIKDVDLEKIIFPTTIEIPRYFPEIYKIVSKRLSLYTSSATNQTPEYLVANYIYFNARYKGSNKLNLTKKDKLLFSAGIRKLLKFEMNCLLQVLNDKKLSSYQKLKTLTDRQNINRFFV